MLEHFHRKENEKKLGLLRLNEWFIKGFVLFLSAGNQILIKIHKRIGAFRNETPLKRGFAPPSKQTHN